jgi:hypothetical protein
MGHLIDIRNMSLLRFQVVNEDFTGFHLVKEHPRNVPCCEMPITGLSDLFSLVDVCPSGRRSVVDAIEILTT